MQISEELQLRIDEARDQVMTNAEREEQAISFVYGNVGLENPAVTRDSVRKIAAQLCVGGSSKPESASGSR